MAISGLDIYKHLPKTNCRECGFPTCLAFAMQLAKRAVALDKCPYILAEAKNILESASLPPIRLVSIGEGENILELGNETVMFRHEEKFFHPTGIGFLIEDNLQENELIERIKKINNLKFERVGQEIKVNLIAIRQTGSADNFIKIVNKVASLTNLAICLISQDTKALKTYLQNYKEKRPLIYALTKDNFDNNSLVVLGANSVIVVLAKSIAELPDLTVRANNAGLSDLLLATEETSLTKKIFELTQFRRLALKKNFRPFSFPTIVIVEEDELFKEVNRVVSYIAKYASVVILKSIEPEIILPILTLRQNIYTDPQRPLQVEPKIYPVGQVNKDSPVLITTNFSLTYYTVLSEVEASKTPCFIVSVDTEGMSVLTAWAAEKFNSEKIVEALKKNNLEERITHKRLIIPGYVAVMSGDLEEKSGYQIIVGPRESAGIPSFLKNLSR
ncbi:MAG: acetyl-CoA decarbonylase/synthase complex subunit gamma [Candidatus Omnitrophota bacterium]|nr:acetyl-CoA decarbonylase/synthase complex subunit gamma [Candidatus Omnitrophota bacterium]